MSQPAVDNGGVSRARHSNKQTNKLRSYGSKLIEKQFTKPRTVPKVKCLIAAHNSEGSCVTYRLTGTVREYICQQSLVSVHSSQ